MEKKKPAAKKKTTSGTKDWDKMYGRYKKTEEVWKAKSVGRPKLFETPEEMKEAAKEYFNWVDNNPLYKSEWKDGLLRSIPVKRPYTLHGLCIYLDCGLAYFREFKRNKERCTPEFMTVISQIEDVIYNQKFEGAAAGFFNSNIIARDLGLADKQDIDTRNLNYNTDITAEEAKEISKGLEENF